MKLTPRLLLIPLVLLLAACNLSLAADVTPPPDYRPPTVESTRPAAQAGPLYPLVAPNPAGGEAIFAEKCAPCHGTTGLGDGPRAADLPNPAPAIGAPEIARSSTPAEWYRIVTEGNLERFMPPFNSLTDRERWDVVAYVYSLSAGPGAEAGTALYADNCAGCHGPDGRGGGPQAAGLASPPTDLANLEWTAAQTGDDFFAAITAGVPPDMPAFAQLSEADRWSLSDFVRTLGFSASGPAAEAQDTSPAGKEPDAQAAAGEAAAEAPAAAPMGTVNGTVTLAGEDASPASGQVTLHAFDGMQLVLTDTVQLQPGGAFRFEDVELPPGRVFLATVEYAGATYGSEVGMVEGETAAVELPPIAVYETTTDASALTVERLHLFFEFLDPQTMRVIELYVVSNPGDKTVTPPEEGAPVLNFTVPEGAQNLQIQNGQLGDGRFVEAAGGFGMSVPIQPGQGATQVIYAFELPYNRKLELAQPMRLPADALVVMVPAGDIKVRGEGLTDAGTRPVEDQEYQMYNGEALAAGDELRLTVTGRAAGGAALALGSNQELVFGAAALGLVLIGAGLLLFRRTRESAADDLDDDVALAPAVEDSPETVMDAILALDDQYKAGRLAEDAYRARRAELKARLKELLD